MSTDGVAAVGAVAVVCCAGGPAIRAVVGGLTAGAVVGIGAGVVAAATVVALVILRPRGRRSGPRVDSG
jgi:hypothetical protein